MTRRQRMQGVMGLVFAVTALVPAARAAEPQNTTARIDDAVRIEAEYKLAVPPGESDAVWAYLQDRYSTDAEDSLFEDVSGEFVTTFST
jgi:hypothetical protein